MLPLRDTVTFPDTLTPLAVGQERSIRLINDVLGGNRMLVDGRQPRPRSPTRRDRTSCIASASIGTVARMLKVPDGTLRILVQAGPRVRIEEFETEQPYLVARVVPRAGHRERGAGAHGAHAQRAGDVLAHHRGRPVPAGGAAARGRQPRRPSALVAPDRRRAADQDRGEAGAARGARRRPSGCAGSPRSSRASWRSPRSARASSRRSSPSWTARSASTSCASSSRRSRRSWASATRRGGGRRAARAARRDRPARGRARARPTASCRGWRSCRRPRPSTA